MKYRDMLSDLEYTEEIEIETEHALYLKTEENFLVCKKCGHRITRMENMILVDSQFKYTFTNLSGVAYTIGCFSEAEGCIEYGIPTTEFSWFDGFRWCFALCSSCSHHLGWYYISSQESFFGLILDRLVEKITTH